MSKILEVNDLCKSFVVKKRLLGENDVVSAVNHVSLGLEEGEVLGIVGESGCGKSTFLRTLNRMNDLPEPQDECTAEHHLRPDGQSGAQR